MPLTSKQIELLRELSESGGIDAIFGNVDLLIGSEWRAGADIDARELSHAKYMALRDIRRELRKQIGMNDGG